MFEICINSQSVSQKTTDYVFDKDRAKEHTKCLKLSHLIKMYQNETEVKLFK